MKPRPATQAALPAAALTALGIVYGDLGTSPLYAVQAVAGAVGGQFTAQSALGMLSLIVWTLIVTISVKYCLLVMRADNHGEGGILALMSLVGANRLGGRMGWLTAAGLLGAALIYGDGVITPAISVLSSLEGVNVVTTSLAPYVMPLGVLILLALFAVQRFGTASIGFAFGPIMLVWFLVIGALGLTGLVRHPVALAAIDPRYAVAYLAHAGRTGLLVLGGVFLCATGGEALYADMGHIGKWPIRLSWYLLVLPALLLNYAGQTGVLIDRHGGGAPFFLLAPGWAVYPLVGLATVATIIASQAIITGSFSMTRQAMQLGWLPGVDIRQTSDEVHGQIYVPVVNGLMAIVTIGITIAFGSSARLAGAYGAAVSTTMLLTTVLLLAAMIRVWRWPPRLALPAAAVFLVVDAGFFGANLMKVAQGGWLPLTLGAVVFFVMATWNAGAQAVHRSYLARREPVRRFTARLRRKKAPRVPGVAIFLTRAEDQIPSLMTDFVKQVGSMHAKVIVLTVVFDDRPRVPPDERSEVTRMARDMWRVTLRFGFVEIPNLPAALARVDDLPCADLVKDAVFFAARDLVVGKARGRLRGGRLGLFAWLFRNSVKAVDRFQLPPRHVIEIAREIEI
ncbi:MAG TPA: KUP/HAK/KT family potassium transporter [Caulobacteraceae bacterium]